MTLEDLATHKIAILGYGLEGQAVKAYLEKHNIEATVIDEKPLTSSLKDFTVIFRSPGIWRKHPLLLEAESAGSIITSQTKWFFEHTQAKIIGVTGTKGKGTTTTLIYKILQRAGRNTYLTGNIGKQQPLEFIDETTHEDWIAFELSSFQLQDLQTSPHIGVCVMVTSDHLDHHQNIQEYHQAKTAIAAFQESGDFAIYNADYDASVQIGSQGTGKKFTVSNKTQPEGEGAFIHSDVSAGSIEITFQGQSFNLDCSQRKLRGAHNLENIAAASLACLAAGVNIETIQEEINEFAGLEHRLQFIGGFNGVSYYEDSYSTVPETTIAAVRSFTEPVHLFLGGSDKGLSYDGLISELKDSDHIASITLLGEVGGKLKTLFEEAQMNIPVFGPYTEFESAVKDTIDRTKPGEVVLLSPATASFDMFANYGERGRQFTSLVKKFTS